MIAANINRVLEVVYRIPTDPSAWADLCDELATLFRGAGTVIQARTPTIELPVSASFRAWKQDFVHSLWLREAQREQAWHRLAKDGCFLDQDFFKDQIDLEADEFYKRMLEPRNLAWSANCGFRSGGEWFVASVWRDQRTGQFSLEDKLLLQMIGRHLSCSMTLAAQISERSAKGALDAFASIGVPAFAIDDKGKVATLNRLAMSQLGKRFELVRGALCNADGTRNPDIDALLSLSISQPEQSLRWNGAVIFEKDDAPIIMELKSLEVTTDPIVSSVNRLLVVLDPGQKRAAKRDLVGSAFGLSHAETTALAHLTKGLSVDECCQAMQITRATFKAHLKSLFRKTRTSRQSQLVALATRMSILAD